MGFREILRRADGDELDLANEDYDRNARRLSRTRRHMVADLVEMRKMRDLSQAQVARAIGIHRSGVSKFEANASTANPTLEVLLRYAHAVGAALDIKVRRIEDPEPISGIELRLTVTVRAWEDRPLPVAHVPRTPPRELTFGPNHLIAPWVDFADHDDLLAK